MGSIHSTRHVGYSDAGYSVVTGRPFTVGGGGGGARFARIPRARSSRDCERTYFSGHPIGRWSIFRPQRVETSTRSSAWCATSLRELRQQRAEIYLQSNILDRSHCIVLRDRPGDVTSGAAASRRRQAACPPVCDQISHDPDCVEMSLIRDACCRCCRSSRPGPGAGRIGSTDELRIASSTREIGVRSVWRQPRRGGWCSGRALVVAARRWIGCAVREPLRGLAVRLRGRSARASRGRAVAVSVAAGRVPCRRGAPSVSNPAAACATKDEFS